MFTVNGTIDSVAYRVGVHPEPVEGNEHGCVMGSTGAVAVLALHEGDEVQSSPTHEPVTLSLTDPTSILHGLYQHTSVTRVEGDGIPDVHGLDAPGTLY